MLGNCIWNCIFYDFREAKVWVKSCQSMDFVDSWFLLQFDFLFMIYVILKYLMEGMVCLDKDLFYTCMFLIEKCKNKIIPIHIKNNWHLGNLWREF